MNLSVIWSVAMTEFSLGRRLFRTWFMILIGVIFTLVAAFGVIFNYTSFSSVSSATFIYSPLMQSVQSLPTMYLFVTIAIIFLCMDVYTRDKRERIDEVFGTLPVSNTELVFGRALGSSLLLTLFVAIILILLYTAGLVVEIALPDVGYGPPEFWSFLALLVLDTFPNIFSFAAVTIFLAMLLRYRILVLPLAIGLFGSLVWLQNNTPLYISQMINSLTSGVVMPSEIVPVFANTVVLTQRIGLLLLSFALLGWAALLSPRQDNSTNRTQPTLVALGLSIGTVLVFSAASYQFFAEVNRHEDYVQVHEAEGNNDDLDLIALTGQVELDPGDAVLINVELSFEPKRHFAVGETLYFSLNPAYDIKSLAVNQNEVPYSFDTGLIKVPLDQSINAGTLTRLSIQAEGDPDPRFAYLDSLLDIRTANIIEVVGLFFMGREESINRGSYVALMPAIAWYPMPGSHINRENKWARSRDFYELNIEIKVPEDWHVASVGRAIVEDSTNERKITFNPPNPVHEVALIASEFERMSVEVEDIEFEFLVPPGHATNLKVFEVIGEELQDRVSETLQLAKSFGLQYPFETFTIVEVPSYLRTYRGGWKMESIQSMPGLFLVREGTFLSANFETPVNAILESEDVPEEEKKERLLYLALSYFNNDINGGNISVAFADNLLQYQTDATGRGAVPISYLMDYMLKSVVFDQQSFYSIHVLVAAESFAVTSIGLTQISLEQIDASLNQYFFQSNINQPPVWDAMLDRPMAEFDYTDRDAAKDNLHILHLRGRNMGQLLSNWLGRNNVGKLLAEIVSRYQGGNYTLEDVLALSQELNLDTEELLANWLDDESLPGFITSVAETVRLPDLEFSVPQYETSFLIKNGEPAPGLFSLGYGGGSTEVEESSFISPIKVDGESSVQVSLVSEEPIESILIEPYFSLNREPFTVQINLSRDYPDVDRDANPFVQPVIWVEQNPDAIILDDLDDGFYVTEATDSGNQRGGFESWLLGLVTTFAPESPMDAGLRSFEGGFTTFGQWTRQQLNTGYGKYRRTTARVQPQSTTATANFTVNLPHSGSWALDYHLPEPGTNNPFAAAFGGAQVVVNTERRRRGPDYGTLNLELVDGDKTEPINFDAEDAEMGWNRIGQFDLSNRAVTLVVKPISNRSPVFADAIRWIPIESDA